MAITRKRYNHVLAWTSVWILAPVIIRETIMDFSNSTAPPRWFTVNILLAAAASAWHWQTNKPYSIPHLLDTCLSGVSIIAHVMLLDRLAACCFALTIAFLFKKSKNETSNLLKQLNKVNWTRALWYHALFRYSAFCLSMYAHKDALLYPKTSSEWFLCFVLFTVAYISHVHWLAK